MGAMDDIPKKKRRFKVVSNRLRTSPEMPWATSENKKRLLRRLLETREFCNDNFNDRFCALRQRVSRTLDPKSLWQKCQQLIVYIIVEYILCILCIWFDNIIYIYVCTHVCVLVGVKLQTKMPSWGGEFETLLHQHRGKELKTCTFFELSENRFEWRDRRNSIFFSENMQFTLGSVICRRNDIFSTWTCQLKTAKAISTIY